MFIHDSMKKVHLNLNPGSIFEVNNEWKLGWF